MRLAYKIGLGILILFLTWFFYALFTFKEMDIFIPIIVGLAAVPVFIGYFYKDINKSHSFHGVTLSILDLAPIVEGGTAADSFRNTLDLPAMPKYGGTAGIGLRSTIICPV
jgi:hypothetical protein